LSTERFAHPFAVARGAGFVFLATWTARAADVDFRPVMTFGVFHSGNIAVTGAGPGDEGAALAFDLNVERATASSTLAFSYRPSYVVYRKSSDLDYFGNTVVLGYSKEYSKSSNFRLDVYASRTDYQGASQDTKDAAITFVPRTTLTQGNVKAGGTVGAGRRGFVDWELRAGLDKYTDVKDDPATTALDGFDFNDTTAFGGRVAWRSEVSARNTLGFGVLASLFGYETGPNVVVEAIGLVGTCEISTFWRLDYAAGASRAVSDADSIDGFSFDATFEYAAGKETTLSAGARQVFAPGTGIGAATQDRGVWIGYAHAPTAKGLSGSVVGGYWQRDELAFGSAGPTNNTESLNVNGMLGWNFNRYLALEANYAYIDQSSRDGSIASLDTNYSSYGLFLRWAIRGR